MHFFHPSGESCTFRSFSTREDVCCPALTKMYVVLFILSKIVHRYVTVSEFR